MVIFDTNMILRYLLNDNQEMADKAEWYLENESVHVTVEVIAETVYVLKGVYSLERKPISETIKRFLTLVECRYTAALNVALDTFEKSNLDFVDCVLFGYYSAEGAEIATFDKKLLHLIAHNAKEN